VPSRRMRIIYAVFGGYLCDWVFGWSMLYLGRYTHDRTYQFYIAPGEWMVDPLRAPWAALLFWTAIFATAWYVVAARLGRTVAPAAAAAADDAS
jgi:hypothetical protein